MKKNYIYPRIRCVVMNDDLMLSISDIQVKSTSDLNQTSTYENVPFSKEAITVNKAGAQGLGAKSENNSDWDD